MAFENVSTHQSASNNLDGPFSSVVQLQQQDAQQALTTAQPTPAHCQGFWSGAWDVTRELVRGGVDEESIIRCECWRMLQLELVWALQPSCSVLKSVKSQAPLPPHMVDMSSTSMLVPGGTMHLSWLIRINLVLLSCKAHGMVYRELVPERSMRLLVSPAVQRAVLPHPL